MTEPLISLALPIKNGLPSLKRAIEALQRQTYRNFELIVQDGGSIDGSLDYLRTTDLPKIDIVCQRDSGHGQAFNRSWARCRGQLACMLACDEFLEDDALENYVKWYHQHPQAAFCYGYSRLWKNDTEIHSIVRSGPFDLLKLITAEYCPPAGAGFYNKDVIGTDFYYDENLKTCPDFDFFIRLGLRFTRLEIIEKDVIVFNSIRDRSYTTFRPQSYDQIAQDKLYILDRLFVNQGNCRFNHRLRNVCVSSMYGWLASLSWDLAGETPQFYKYVIEAAKHDPGSDKIAALVARTRGLTMDPQTGQVLMHTTIQPEYPPSTAVTLDGAIAITSAHSDKAWGLAQATPNGFAMRVNTDSAPWSYAAEVPLSVTDFSHGGWYWLEVELKVESGQLGVGILDRQMGLKRERLLSSNICSKLVFPISSTDRALIIRNGSYAESSTMDLVDAKVYAMPIPQVRAAQ